RPLSRPSRATSQGAPCLVARRLAMEARRSALNSAGQSRFSTTTGACTLPTTAIIGSGVWISPRASSDRRGKRRGCAYRRRRGWSIRPIGLGQSEIHRTGPGRQPIPRGLQASKSRHIRNITTIANNSGGSSFGYDDVLSTQTYIGLMGFGFDPVANRLVIADYNSRLRQIFYTPPTVTTLTSSPNPAASGSVVTLQVTVSPATATGSFRFYNDTPAPAFLGSVPVSNGTASFSWTLPAQNVSSYQVRAVYGGDANDNL